MMFNVGDYIIYKRDLCIIKNIKDNERMKKTYYVLAPVEDDSLIIDVPVDNTFGYLRPVIKKEEAEQIINNIPNVDMIESNERMMENEYRNLMKSGTHEDLIKVIKTTYHRNEERRVAGKKIGDKDHNYFQKAETFLYNELSVALGMTYDECKEYVIEKVANLAS